MVDSAVPVQEVEDVAELAGSVGLVYRPDEEPGIVRRPCGSGFTYVSPEGDTIRNGDLRAWIKGLAVPPAWTDVWISPDDSGHLLATGRDSEGRKQYLYHPRWVEVRDAIKFEHMIDFGRHLKGIRDRIHRDMQADDLSKRQVLATVVRLLDLTLIRVGNDRYAEDNETFGLTTLRSEHVAVSGDTVRFEFEAKNSTPMEATVVDERVAPIIASCLHVNGDRLFCYRSEDGGIIGVDSSQVNQYLRDISDPSVSAKSFRTWGASSTAVRHLASEGTGDDPDGEYLAAVDAAAEVLGNTRAVCRASYVHPRVEEAHLGGEIRGAWSASRTSRWYQRCERALLKLLG